MNDKHPAGAETERSFLKYCSDDYNTSKSKNHDGIDMLLEEMGEKRFAAMVEKTEKLRIQSGTLVQRVMMGGAEHLFGGRTRNCNWPWKLYQCS